MLRIIWTMRRRITKMKWNEDNTKVMMIWMMRRMMMIRIRIKMKIHLGGRCEHVCG